MTDLTSGTCAGLDAFCVNLTSADFLPGEVADKVRRNRYDAATMITRRQMQTNTGAGTLDHRR